MKGKVCYDKHGRCYIEWEGKPQSVSAFNVLGNGEYHNPNDNVKEKQLETVRKNLREYLQKSTEKGRAK